MQDREQPRDPSRRKFVFTLLGAAVVGGVIGKGRLDKLERFGELFVNQLPNDYGIFVPPSTDERFFVEDETLAALYDPIARKPTELKKEEIGVIEEALSYIPYAKSIAPLLLPYRYEAQSDDFGYTGIYWGHFWSRSIKNIDHKHLDDTSAIALFLSDNFDLNRKVEPSFQFTGIAGDKGRSTALNEIPLGTYRDSLKRVVLHEYGHALADAVFFLARSAEEYINEADNSVNVPYYNVLANHPIYQSFAKVNGWKLVPLDETGVGLDSDNYKIALESGEYPWGSTGAWIRDTEIWGEGPYESIPWFVPDDKVRLTQYASVAMIHETFAEFFMASVLHPEFLTEEERMYFGRLHEGLNGNAKEFLQQIADNPDILL